MEAHRSISSTFLGFVVRCFSYFSKMIFSSCMAQRQLRADGVPLRDEFVKVKKNKAKDNRDFKNLNVNGGFFFSACTNCILLFH